MSKPLKSMNDEERKIAIGRRLHEGLGCLSALDAKNRGVKYYKEKK